MKSLTSFLFPFLLLTGPVLCTAQCSDGSTQLSYINSVSRTASNNVEAIVGTQVVGDYSDYWDVYVSAYETLNNNVTLHAGNDTQYGSSDVPGVGPAAAGFRWNDAPSNAGAGDYQAITYHEFHVDCGEYSQDYQASASSTLSVQKPTITGLLTEWYLGPDGDNQYLYAHQNPVTANPNCGSNDTCNDVPNWSVTGDTQAVSFSCMSCTDTTIYAERYSVDFQDIQLSFNIGGFSADPQPYTVYSPWRLIVSSYNRGDLNDGYETDAVFTLYDKFGDEIAGLAANEKFDNSFIPDTSNVEGYCSPTSCGPTAVGTPAGWQYLGDHMFISGCSTLPTACSNYSNAPPSSVDIFHTLQDWQLGSARVGAGLTIEIDEQHYFGNYAEYQRVTTPTQP